MTKLANGTNQEAFIIDAGVREEHMNRVEVLEKVKDLLLLPNTEYATSQLVAEFYETDPTNINNLLSRHKDELLSDGITLVKRGNVGEILKPQNEFLEMTPYVAVLKDENGGEYKFSNRGSYVFPRRAILRVGMLLRDSEIAQEVRTQLLNIEEKATKEVKVQDVNEELALQTAVEVAYKRGNINELAAATTNLIAYMKRYHTEELQQKNTVIRTLAKEEVQYKSPNKLLHALIKRYGAVVYGSVSTGKDWSDLCRHLLNKLGTGINLKARKTRAINNGDRNASLMSVIRPEEFPNIITVMVGLCENSGVDISDIMRNA